MYRNWPEIYKWSDDFSLMHLLSYVDFESEVGKRLMRGFPECFSEIELKNIPVPIHAIKELYASGDEFCGNGSLSEAADFVWACEKLGIPFLAYRYFKRPLVCESDFKPAPLNIRAILKDRKARNPVNSFISHEGDEYYFAYISYYRCVLIPTRWVCLAKHEKPA